MKRFYRLIVQEDRDGNKLYSADNPDLCIGNIADARLYQVDKNDLGDPTEYWRGLATVEFLPEDQQMKLNGQKALSW